MKPRHTVTALLTAVLTAAASTGCQIQTRPTPGSRTIAQPADDVIRWIHVDLDRNLTPGSAAWSALTGALATPFNGWTGLVIDTPPVRASRYAGHDPRVIDLVLTRLEGLPVHVVWTPSDAGYLRSKPIRFGDQVITMVAGQWADHGGNARGGADHAASARRREARELGLWIEAGSRAAWVAAIGEGPHQCRASVVDGDLHVEVTKLAGDDDASTNGTVADRFTLPKRPDPSSARSWFDWRRDQLASLPPLPTLPPETMANLGRVDLDGQRDHLELAVANPLDQPIRVAVEWEQQAPWSITPSVADVTIGPGETGRLRYDLGVSASGFSYPPPGASVWIRASGATLHEGPVMVRAYNRPTAQAAWTDAPPPAEAFLDSDAWRHAERLTLDWRPNGEGSATAPTRAAILTSPEGLHIAVAADHAPGQPLHLAAQGHGDPNAWQDDCVELFVDANHDRTSARQFIVTAGGAAATSAFRFVNGQTRWGANFDEPWTARTRLRDDGWDAVIDLPWSTIQLDGPPADLARLGFNLTRLQRHGQAGGDEGAGEPLPFDYSQWAVTYLGNGEVPAFGVLNLPAPPDSAAP